MRLPPPPAKVAIKVDSLLRDFILQGGFDLTDRKNT